MKMSIKQGTYDLCKEVWVSPFRDEIANLVKRLTSSSQEDRDNNKDISEFGYMSRGLNLQFGGYLKLDYDLHNGRIDDVYLQNLVGLDESERALINRGHVTLRELDAKCLDVILKEIPNIRNIVDPYVNVNSNNMDKVDDLMLSRTTIDAFSSLFAEHRGISWALETLEVIGDQSIERYSELLKGLLAGIKDKGRSDLVLNGLRRKDSKDRKVLKHLFSLLALQESVHLVNQLVYQSVSTDKLLYFGISNIVSIDSEVHKVDGTYYSFTCPFNKESLSVEPGDIVLYQPYENDEPRLCQVLWINMSMSGLDGALYKFDLVGINNELHRYSVIFDTLEGTNQM